MPRHYPVSWQSFQVHHRHSVAFKMCPNAFEDPDPTCFDIPQTPSWLGRYTSLFLFPTSLTPWLLPYCHLVTDPHINLGMRTSIVDYIPCSQPVPTQEQDEQQLSSCQHLPFQKEPEQHAWQLSHRLLSPFQTLHKYSITWMYNNHFIFIQLNNDTYVVKGQPGSVLGLWMLNDWLIVVAFWQLKINEYEWMNEWMCSVLRPLQHKGC